VCGGAGMHLGCDICTWGSEGARQRPASQALAVCVDVLRAALRRCAAGPVCTWGVMSAPGDRREVVMPQVGPTWGCEIFCEPPVRPHPPPVRVGKFTKHTWSEDLRRSGRTVHP
jgi:hypothetical protein